MSPCSSSSSGGSVCEYWSRDENSGGWLKGGDRKY